VPELPEVETLRRQIAPLVIRRRISDVVAGTHPRFSAPHRVIGSTVNTVSRRGKYLVLGLSGSQDLVLHLGMTGQLLWGDDREPESGHAHLGLVFANGVLWLRDSRRFGRAVVVPSGEYGLLPTLAALGPEPDDPLFTTARVQEYLSPDGAPVKARLLEQRLVAGVGNYLADETLWHARVSPFARALSKKECSAVRTALQRVVSASIQAGGVSERDYVHVDGSKGGYASQLTVHGRAGEPCLRCDTRLSYGRIAGRGTVWCQVCQPDTGPRS
jgi:formamidopyrimidine-DNA glycosylase